MEWLFLEPDPRAALTSTGSPVLYLKGQRRDESQGGAAKRNRLAFLP
jgi:hypothetical protein